MDDLRPRKIAHSGSVLASGLAFDANLIPEPVARERILGLTPIGTDVFQAGTVLIVRFKEPLRMPCQSALGVPLVRYCRLLSACPLAPDEQAALETVEEAAVLVSGGVATVTPLAGGSRVDISIWLDASGFAVYPPLNPLGAIASEPRAQLAAVSADLRRSFGVAPLDVKTSQLLQALRERNAAKPAPSSRVSKRSLIARLRAAVARLRLPTLRRARLPAKATPAIAAQPQPVAQAQRLGIRGRVQRYLARRLWSSQFGHLLGRQYGKYFSRLLDMFDGNDLDNALRHALSLNADFVPGEGRLPFWTPKPREDLSIKTDKKVAGNALGLGDELYDMLRQRYRAAFQRLEARGEVEKAAFVLAELLNVSEEAVAFLERHKRFRLAAEIAESRNLATGLIIRLWFLAGDRVRAVRIARRTGAFADAVIRLDASHKQEAAVLRLIWAHTLAEAGQYAGAVEAAWPVEEARNLVFAWMDRAIETGGAAGARMLARKLRTNLQDFVVLRDRAMDFLRDGSANPEPFVKIFGQELIGSPPLSDEVRLMSRETARRLLPYLCDKEGKRFVQELVEASGDSILRADVRGAVSPKSKARSQSAVPLVSRNEPLLIRRSESDRGSIAVWEAAELLDGKMLIAAGELGGLLLSRDGKTIARFSEPASRIVMSDHGDRAMLLAKRGDAFHVTRVDLMTKRQSVWCDARFDLFAPDFDGLTWFVARGGVLYAIDALAKRWETLWKVDEREATITSVRRNASAVSAFFKWEGRNSESWTYEYPSLILRQRRLINQGEGRFTSECVAPSGDFAGWRLFNEVFAAYLHIEHGWITLPLNASDNTQAHCVTNEWIVMSSSGGGATTVFVLDYNRMQVRARIEFEGADVRIAARIQDTRLTVCDDRARVLVIDLGTGEILREHRVAG